MFRSPYAMLLMALVGFALSAASYYGSRDADWRELSAHFNERTNAQHSLVRAKLESFPASLSHLRDFFVADRPLGPEKFHQIARSEMARNPGLSEIQWVPVVSANDRAA